jgi:hypothetical protein
MKKRLSLLLVLACAVILMTGCVGMNYTGHVVTTTTNTNGVVTVVTNDVTINANRFIWSTGSYVAKIGPSGTGSLTVSKSSVDSVALGTIISGVQAAAAKGAP